MARRDQSKQEVGRARIEGLVSELVAQQHRGPLIATQDSAIRAIGEGCLQILQHLRGDDIERVEAFLARGASECLEDARLAEARAADTDDVARLLDPAAVHAPTRSRPTTGSSPSLRLPGRALEAPAHDQPHRVDVLHCAPQAQSNQRLGHARHLPGDGLQVGSGSSRRLAQTRWLKPPERDPSRSSVQGWIQGRRRMSARISSTTMDHCSAKGRPRSNACVRSGVARSAGSSVSWVLVVRTRSHRAGRRRLAAAAALRDHGAVPLARTSRGR